MYVRALHLPYFGHTKRICAKSPVVGSNAWNHIELHLGLPRPLQQPPW